MKVEDEEFEDFVDRVDEVEKTIKALLDGKIDVESVDRKEQEIRRKQQETEEKKKKKLEEQRKLAKRMERNQERKKWGFAGRWCPRCRRDEYKILEDVYGPDESNWPEEIPPTCFSTQCKDVEPPVRLLSPEERRQELQHKVCAHDPCVSEAGAGRGAEGGESEESTSSGSMEQVEINAEVQPSRSRVGRML